ncbi:unnamed protein product, partial [Closterium sp. NIES-53]
DLCHVVAAAQWFSTHLHRAIPILIVSDELAAARGSMPLGEVLQAVQRNEVVVMTTEAFFQTYYGHCTTVITLMDSLVSTRNPTA